jgi:hypothetical protein
MGKVIRLTESDLVRIVERIISEQTTNQKKFKMNNSEYVITSSEQSGNEFYKIQYSKVMPNGMIEKKSTIGYIGKKYPGDIQPQPSYKNPIGKSNTSIWDLINVVNPNSTTSMDRKLEGEYIRKFAGMISNDMQIEDKEIYSKKLNLVIEFKFNGDFLIIKRIKIPMKYETIQGKKSEINFDDRDNINLDFRVHPTFDEREAKMVASEIFKAKKSLDDINNRKIGKELDTKGVGKTKGTKPNLSSTTPFDGDKVSSDIKNTTNYNW